MSSTPSVAGKLAKEACSRFKKTATKTLAAKLFKDNPEVYNDLEHARGFVRYYRGEKGKRMRREMLDSSLVETKKTSFNIEIPESDATPVEPYILKATGKGMIMGDIHFPYHDPTALRVAMEYAAEKGYTDFLVLNGDILDTYQLSRWTRDPRRRDFAGELEMVKGCLSNWTGIWKKVIWKMGNHERRWWDYMQRKAPELIGIEALNWESLVGAKEIGFDVVGWNQVIYAGELTILHGHEYGGSLFSPVNPARGAFIRAHSCTVSGHLHRGSNHQEPDIRGELTSCWSHGCMCEMHPEYAPLTKWDHSFLLMDFDGEWFEIQLRKIINGRIA